jgi:hypothetical protein
MSEISSFVKIVLCLKSIDPTNGNISIALDDNLDIPQQTLYVPKSEYIAKQLCNKYIAAPLTWYDLKPYRFIDIDNKIYLIYQSLLLNNTPLKNGIRWFTYDEIIKQTNRITNIDLITKCLFD